MIRRKNILTFFLGLTTFLVQGQYLTKDFGEISQEEIELKEYALDKGAEAVVLLDKGKSYFIETNDYSFNVVYERTTRIKILSEAGIKYGQVEFYFYQQGEVYEKIYDVEAYSYNLENGKVNKTKLDISNTFDEKINESWKNKKFAIPNVKVGSVVEYRYKIVSPYLELRDWNFQWEIPVVYSEYEVRMIPYLEYTFVLQAANKFDVSESYEDKASPRHYGSPSTHGDNTYHDMIYKYGMKNVPAFKSESYISSIQDYVINLDFQLTKIHPLDGSVIETFTTWESYIKKLLTDEDFGKYISKSEKTGANLLDIESVSQKPETEKFNTVLDYVKRNYNWNNYYAKYTSKSPNDLIKDKIGNCADINLFAIGLLNAIGIEAYPLILSTRDNGKINIDYPFVRYFNYVIILAYVDGKLIISDATEVFCSNDRVPIRCLNDKGLVIRKDKVEWISLECKFPSNKSTFMQMEMKENEVRVDKIIQATEYKALYFRNNYPDKNELVKQKLINNNDDYLVIDSTIQIENYADITKPYKLKYSFTTKQEIVNNKMYISPFLNESISDNPLKDEERKYPIDMVYPKKESFNTIIPLPEGYQIDFVPEDLKISNEFFELNYSINTNNNKIQVVFYYYFKKSVYQTADYAIIKSYLNEIVKKGNEKIVLTKK